MSRYLLLSIIISLVTTISGCSAGGRMLSFPYDSGGRSLNGPTSDLQPQISGRYIVFVSDRRGTQNIYLFDTQERIILDLPGLNSLDMISAEPSASGDGRYIVFSGTRQGRSSIYLYDRELQQLRNLTENLSAEVRNPTISNDGSTIAFETSENGQWDLVVYDKSGQRLNIP